MYLHALCIYIIFTCNNIKDNDRKALTQVSACQKAKPKPCGNAAAVKFSMRWSTKPRANDSSVADIDE